MTALCLADLGAEVIKLEGIPDGDYSRRMGAVDEHSSIAFIGLNQNKRSVQIDHRSSAGQGVIHDLVRSADVFIESARPGSLGRLQLDADTLRSINPRLVYASISAYGAVGPLGNWPGHGYNIEANAGLVQVTVDPDGSLRLPEYALLVANVGTGYQAAMAIAASLARAARTGEGATIEVAAYDAGIAFDPGEGAHVLNDIAHDDTIGTRLTPKYAAYRTKDDEYILLATIEGKFWNQFCELIDRPDLAPRHRHDLASDWGQDHPELYDEIAVIFRQRTLTEWMDLVATNPLPISPITPLKDVTKTPHFAARDMVRTTTSRSGKSVRTIRPAVIFDAERLGKEGRWSELGEDTAEVLRSLGYDGARIKELEGSGTVRQG